MVAIGGSLESISIEGRSFAVAADAEANRKLGGYENEVQSNGDGSARIIKTRVPWMLDGVVVEIDDSRNDQEFLQNLADQNAFATILLVEASGDAYQGTGQLTGEMQKSTQSSTMPLSIMGTQALTKQV